MCELVRELAEYEKATADDVSATSAAFRAALAPDAAPRLDCVLAVADVVLLDRALGALLNDGDERLLDSYAETALQRIWKAQHFSWWMTSMLHLTPEASDFDRRRQIGELRSVVESEAGQTYLAEAYTGWQFA